MRAWLIKTTRARKAKRVLLGVIKRGARMKSIPALPILAKTHRFGAMRKGSDAQRVLADKAHASKANHADLRGQLRGDILQKTVRGRPLCPSQKRFNKLIPKQRFGVEQCFGKILRLFGLP